MRGGGSPGLQGAQRPKAGDTPRASAAVPADVRCAVGSAHFEARGGRGKGNGQGPEPGQPVVTRSWARKCRLAPEKQNRTRVARGGAGAAGADAVVRGRLGDRRPDGPETPRGLDRGCAGVEPGQRRRARRAICECCQCFT